MKQLISILFSVLALVACTQPEIGLEELAPTEIAQDNAIPEPPAFDHTQTYYAHFEVWLEDGTSAILNTIQLDETHWLVEDAGKALPNLPRIQEELGYEAMETLRGKPVKFVSIPIVQEEQKAELDHSRTMPYCDDYHAFDFKSVPTCTCESELLAVIDAYLAGLIPMSILAPVGDGYIVYCNINDSGGIDGAVWVPLGL